MIRPFNCVGTGESKAIVDKEVFSGNIKLAISHVLPDLAQKVLKGQRPLHILGNGDQIRHYTHGRDLARGIRLAMESPAAICEDFNISTDVWTNVLELARLVWQIAEVKAPFDYVCDEPFIHDVQRRDSGHHKGAAGSRLQGGDTHRTKCPRSGGLGAQRDRARSALSSDRLALSRRTVGVTQV